MEAKSLVIEKKSLLLDVEGMKCGGCVNSVEKILLSLPCISKASVNLVAHTAWIELESHDAKIDPILNALADRGFPAKERSSMTSQENLLEKQSNQALFKQWRQLIVAIVLLLLSVVGHLAESGKLQIPIVGSLWFHASLATVALALPGKQILSRGFKAALALDPNMDTLVGMGVSSAYIASLIALIWPKVGWPCFFNEPVMLLGFVLLGRFLEERARFRTGLAIKKLAQLQPEFANLVINENETREVRVGALRPGEKIQLFPGDRVPIDGIVLEGISAIDISNITGEPIPLEASPGQELSAGSLNLESTLIIEVKNVGAKTTLANIIRLVEKAQARKAPIQTLADRIAGKFCYGVVTLSILTFIFWWKFGTRLWPNVLNASGQGFLHNHGHNLHSTLGQNAETPLGLALQLSIAVLVVACPCALGLATPTVITVASGKAARNGWLFKGGDIIEIASSIKNIIFDKTGTITIGKPFITQLFNRGEENKTLLIAASLETKSRHPLGQAILQEAEARDLKLLKNIRNTTLPGKGIVGELDGVQGTIRVGKPEWLLDEGVVFDQEINSEITKIANQGQSLVAIAQNNQFLGLIVIDDLIRPDVDVALNRLRRQGFKLNILSGDRKEAVLRLGRELGFNDNELGWQLLPEEKLTRLEILKDSEPLAMVGDGINDAPALAAADLGIAIGTGTQIAQDSADLVLMGDRLEGLPDALLLSRQTMGKIKQNLFWAFSYNLIALPIAAGALLPTHGLLLSPPIAALLMATSSITVVLNALSLNKT